MTGGRDSPTVDVLIVSYNTRDLLAECLTSIQEHLPDPRVARVGVRVLDNRSSDGSAEMVAQRFPDVSIEATPSNLGFARANNSLVQGSSAEYVMLLNPDTRWTQDLVEPLLDALRTSPRAVAVGPRLEWPDGRRQPSAQELPTLPYEFAVAIRGRWLCRLCHRFWDAEELIRRIEGHGMDLSAPREIPSLWATCWLMRRTDVMKLGLFDERYVTYDEDLDFCQRMGTQGRTLLYEPRVPLVHIGGSSSSESAKKDLTRRSRRLYYRLHHGRAVAWTYARGIPTLLQMDAVRADVMRRLSQARRARA